MLLNGAISESIAGEFSATFQNTDDEKNPEVDAAYSPDWIIHAKSHYTHEAMTFSLLGRYVSSMQPLYDLTKENSDGSFGARIGDSVDSYFVLDANIGHDKIWGDVYLNIKFTNLFNETIRYPNDQIRSELLDRGTLGAERAVMGTVGFKF